MLYSSITSVSAKKKRGSRGEERGRGADGCLLCQMEKRSRSGAEIKKKKREGEETDEGARPRWRGEKRKRSLCSFANG